MVNNIILDFIFLQSVAKSSLFSKENRGMHDNEKEIIFNTSEHFKVEKWLNVIVLRILALCTY